VGNRDVASVERVLNGERVAPNRLMLACVLAWLMPGAGHWYLGKKARAAVFFSLVTLSFVLGSLLDGRFSVLDPRQPLLSALQVVACLGSGPMDVVARAAIYGAPVYRMPEDDAVLPGEAARRPRTAVGIALRARNEAHDSAYGTAYLWTAGLMNLLLILDVFDIGVGRKN